MEQTRIIVGVFTADAELVAERLLEAGLPFEQRDSGTLDPPPAGEVHFTLWCEPAIGKQMHDDVQRMLRELHVSSAVSSTVVDGDQYRDSWKEYFKPRPVGPFVLVPSWERYVPAAGETIVALDPGRAFGTGGHASTRLCLRALGRLDGCHRFLDVGTGSGVLAIACALRWPSSSGVAIDVDPESVEVTRENAVINHVDARIRVESTPVARVEGSFDVVLANITSEVILALAPDVAARVATGGRLVASGLLAVETDRVAAELARHGLTLERSDDEEEWRALTLVKNA